MLPFPRLLCWVEYLPPVRVGEREEPYTDCQSSFPMHYFVMARPALDHLSAWLNLGAHFDRRQFCVSSVFIEHSAVVIQLEFNEWNGMNIMEKELQHQQMLKFCFFVWIFWNRLVIKVIVMWQLCELLL